MSKPINQNTILSSCAIDHAPRDSNQARERFDDVRHRVCQHYENNGHGFFPGECPDFMITDSFLAELVDIRIQNAQEKNDNSDKK